MPPARVTPGPETGTIGQWNVCIMLNTSTIGNLHFSFNHRNFLCLLTVMPVVSLGIV